MLSNNGLCLRAAAQYVLLFLVLMVNSNRFHKIPKREYNQKSLLTKSTAGISHMLTSIVNFAKAYRLHIFLSHTTHLPSPSPRSKIKGFILDMSFFSSSIFILLNSMTSDFLFSLTILDLLILKSYILKLHQIDFEESVHFLWLN